MSQKSRYWNQISMRADYGILEIASAYLSDISLGIVDKNTERIFFFDTNRIEDAEKIINELNKKYAIEFSHKKIYDDDWHLKWKDNFTPIFIDDEVVIVPDWDNQRYDCKYVVKIKPGMSFGTGHHETTFLMIRELLKIKEVEEKSLLDLGTGSGILSIVAKKMGFTVVYAIENDEICRSDFFDNLSLNHMDEEISINFRDALQLDNYSYDVILANIEKNIIMDLIPLIKSKGTKLILSGILEEQVDSVTEQLASEGFKNIVMSKRKEWVCIVSEYI